MVIKVEINEKEYQVPEVNFNAVCDLSECGVDIFNTKTLTKKPIVAARAIVSWIIGEDIEVAGTEVQNHILKGYDLAPIFKAFNEAVTESGFIKSLLKKQEGKKPKEPQDHRKPTGM